MAIFLIKQYKAAKKKMCKTCKPPQGNRFGTRSPVEGNNGTWRGGERGLLFDQALAVVRILLKSMD